MDGKAENLLEIILQLTVIKGKTIWIFSITTRTWFPPYMCIYLLDIVDNAIFQIDSVVFFA
jgi:hypothetical protein